MKTILLTIAYDGTGFAGWQTQRSRAAAGIAAGPATVQETVEHALARIVQHPVTLIGSGRTDAGVHALGFRAQFVTDRSIPLIKLRTALNAVLPDTVAVVGARYVAADFHARYHARRKHYQYRIVNSAVRPVFLRAYTWWIRQPLDVPAMCAAAEVLAGTHDFRSFQAADKKERSSVRTIFKAQVRRKKELVLIDITADGFLYNMMRTIAGTLVDIGRGKRDASAMRAILRARQRSAAGPTAPAQGLFLISVAYDRKKT